MSARNLLSRYEHVSTVDVTAQRVDGGDASEGFILAGAGAGVYLEPLGGGAAYPVRVVPDGEPGRAFVLPHPAFVQPGPWRSLRVEGVLPGSRWRLLLASDAGAVAGAPPLAGWVELARVRLFDQMYGAGNRVYVPDVPDAAMNERRLHVFDVQGYRAFAVHCSARDLSSVEEGEGLRVTAHHLMTCDYDGAMSDDYVPDAWAPSPHQVTEASVGPLRNTDGWRAGSIYVGEGVQAVTTPCRVVVPERWRFVAVSVVADGGADCLVVGELSELIVYGVR